MSEIHRYPEVAVMKKTNTYYTYMSIMEQFKDMLLDTDIPLILDDPLSFIYVESSVPFRKRYMKINGKRMIKKDQEMSALRTPLMAVQGSILTDDDARGMFNSDFFNTDMSNIGLAGYGDSILEYYNPDRGIDTACVLIPKQGKLNIEVTIMEDSTQKLENIRESWNKVRRNTSPDTFIGAIENILPPNIAIQMMFELGIVETQEELSTYTYREVFEELRKYTSPSFIMDYVTDTSTSIDEIVIRYPYEILIEPKMINLSPPQQEEWILQGGMLTRGFEVTFTMASLYNIYNATATNKFRGDLINIIRTNVKEPSVEPIKPVKTDSKTSFVTGSNIADGNPLYTFERTDKNLIGTAKYNGVDADLHEIPLWTLIKKDIQGFIQKLKDEDIDVDRYFYIEYKELKGDTYIDIYSGTVVKDYNEMTIRHTNMVENSYSIAIYMNLEEFQNFYLEEE